jgi:hypothetical protein
LDKAQGDNDKRRFRDSHAGNGIDFEVVWMNSVRTGPAQLPTWTLRYITRPDIGKQKDAENDNLQIGIAILRVVVSL